MPIVTPNILLQLKLHDIPDQTLHGFNPTQVVYKEYTLKKIDATYRDIDRPTKTSERGFTTIENWVRDIALKGYKRNPPPPVEKPEKTPLDFTISRDSYVVIELDKTLGCYFTKLIDPTTHRRFEGVSLMWLSADHFNPLAHYANLRYVDDTGQIHNDPADNCRIAFFEARKMQNAKNQYQQRIMYIMDTPSGATRFEDPDIRFPGEGSG